MVKIKKYNRVKGCWKTMRIEDMDESLDELLEQKQMEALMDFLVDFNRQQLNQKEHIKKYSYLRKMHSLITEHMHDDIFSKNYDLEKSIAIINEDYCHILKKDKINVDLKSEDNSLILSELLFYNNHPKIESMTDNYIKNNLFKNEEELKMLKAMQDSYVSLFEIYDVDANNGYIIYQDVVTKRKFKIVDIALSSTYKSPIKVYTYCRIITYDDISFSAGAYCMFTCKSKELMKFINSKKYNNYPSFINCLLLYDISKKDKSIHVSSNNNY